MVQQKKLPNLMKLNNLLSTASATAMVLVNNESSLFEIGDLSERAFRKLHTIVNAYWSDFAIKGANRYVGLVLDGRYRFLFVKNLPQAHQLLGLVFPLETPLIRIRQDMTDIMRDFLVYLKQNSDVDELLEQSLQFDLQTYQEHDPEPPSKPAYTGCEISLNQTTGQIEEASLSEQPINQSDKTEKHPEGNQRRSHPLGMSSHHDKDKISIEGLPIDMDLLSEEIPWQAVETRIPSDIEREQEGISPSIDEDLSQPIETPGNHSDVNTWQPLAEVPGEGDDLVSILQDGFKIGQDAEVVKKTEQPLLQLREAAPKDVIKFPIEDTQPIKTRAAKDHLKEDVSTITFYLVPWHDEIFILGELSHRIRHWLPTICETYGWELDYLSVRPDYLKWTLVDFPERITRDMLMIVRQMTSKRIFRVFPELQKEDQVQDFWSPGYLVDTQNRDFSTQVLIAHIAASRL